MKVNFGHTLVGLNNAPLLDENKQPMTLGAACAAALCTAVGEPTTPSENVRMWKLAMLAMKQETTIVSTEDVALMKQRLASSFAPLIAGQAAVMLEDDDTPSVRAA